MPPLARLAQQINRAAGHNFASMADKRLNHLLQIEHFGLTVDQGHHVDAHDRLQLGLRVQVVEHHITHFSTAQLNHNAETVLVGFITQLGDALELLFFDQLGDALNQARLVQLVGNLVDDDGVFTLRFIADDLGLGPHIDATAPRAIGLHDAGTSIDLGAGGKIGAGDVLHQLIHVDVRVLQGRQTTRDHLT